jgi:hypothetical protein
MERPARGSRRAPCGHDLTRHLANPADHRQRTTRRPLGYLRRPGDTTYRPFVISILGIDGDHLALITAFEAAHLITAFGLPASL